jgi:hypothetical protein
MPAHFLAATPVLVVESPAATRAFFVDRLGFRDRPVPDPAGRIVIERGDVAIVIASQAALQADFGAAFVAGPFSALLSIEVDDVETLVPEIVDTDVVLALRKTAAGTQEIGVREPGGNIIVFASGPRD